ncbi:MAG: right-handed parallel beta-helix repeat-containing protein, partial [Brevinematales bacterium]|nr:right-handed parallel beta-helix repeat-containing protein [Brevinematales bacterium]
NGSVVQIDLIRGDNVSFPVSGTAAWSATVGLLSNKTNNFNMTATSDKGLTGNYFFQIVCDQQMPALNIQYPQNGSTTPRSFNVSAYATDNLSGIEWIAFWMDNGGTTNTSWGPSTGWWYSGLTNGPHQLFMQTKDYAGNKTKVFTNNFTADGTIPTVIIYHQFNSTNYATPTFTGFAEVDPGNSIAKVQISKNGGAYADVNKYTPGSTFVEWTNINTTNLVMNSHNYITIRAITSGNKTNQVDYHFTLDNLPPVLQYFDPANNNYVVNTTDFQFGAGVHDDLSPIMYIAIYSRGPGMAAVVQSNDVRNFYNYYADAWAWSTSSDFGGIFTNVMVARDIAGNSITKTNFVYHYPHLFVDITGSDTTGYGFAHSPYKSLQKAVDKAKQIKVNSIYVWAGTYTKGNGLNTSGSGVVIDGMTNLIISGGWNWNGGMPVHTNMTLFDGGSALNHVVEIRNSTGINMSYFIIKNGMASAAPNNKGGGMYLYNVHYSQFTNIILTNNSATGSQADGGGIYMLSCDWNNFYIAAVKNLANGGGGIAVNNSRWNSFYGYSMYNTAVYTGGGLQINQGSQNNIYMSIYMNTAKYGGGVAMFNGSSDSLYFPGVLLRNAAEYGGGVYISNQYSFNTYIMISNNFATNGAAKLGGGVFIDNSQYANVSGNIYFNYAVAGGGIFLRKSANNTLEANILYNYASSTGGGIALTNSDRNTIRSGSIEYNNAGFNGGGFALVNSKYNVFDNSFIEFNKTLIPSGSDTGGGGGYFESCSGNILYGSVTIQNNQSTNNGGGIAMLKGTANTNYAAIQNNTAYKAGGGVAVKYGSGHYFNSFIGNNSSTDTTGGGGGGGFAANAVSGLNIQGTIFNNYAILKGGGLSIAYCTNSIIGAVVDYNQVITANSSSVGGGGIFMNDGKNNSIVSLIFANNANGGMPYGGGIWISGPHTINAVITNNQAMYGGGIYIYDNNVTVGGGSFVMYNKAGMLGGGIAVGNGPVGNNKIYGNIIGNETIPALAAGSGIYLSGKNNIVQATIVDNMGTGFANGIYAVNTTGNKIMNCVISNNTGFYPMILSTNNSGLIISNNVFAAEAIAGSFGIYEEVPVSGHIVKDNKFCSGLLQYVYYDTVSGIITNAADLNIATKSQASVALGNVWW